MSDRPSRLRPLPVRLPRLAVGLLAVAAAVAIPGTARASTGPACTLSGLSSTNQPACWQPFTATSPFNTQLPANPPLAPDNAAVQQHMAQYGWSLDGSNTSFTVSGHGSRPVYFATPSDPLMTVHCTAAYGPSSCQGANGINVNGMQINVPAGAAPDSNSDAHMTVIEVATGTEFDFWHTSVSGSTITAATGAEINANTSDGTGSAGDAANFGLTAGLLRPSELASGQIDHALVITVPCTDATGRNVGYTYPASGGWGEYCGQWWSEDASTAPMLGQRYQLNMTDAQIAASGAPSWEQTIMTALAHYGAYIEDTNGSWHYEGMDILTQDPASWTDVGQPNSWTSVISALGGSNGTLRSNVPIPVSSLQLVSTCVTQGTCPGAVGAAPTPVIPPVTTTPIPAPPVSVSPAPIQDAAPSTGTTGSASSPSAGSEPAHPTRTARRGIRNRRRAEMRRRLRRVRARRRIENSARRTRGHHHRSGGVRRHHSTRAHRSRHDRRR